MKSWAGEGSKGKGTLRGHHEVSIETSFMQLDMVTLSQCLSAVSTKAEGSEENHRILSPIERHRMYWNSVTGKLRKAMHLL